MKIGYYSKKNVKNNVVSFLEEHSKKQPNKIAFYFLSKKLNDLQSFSGSRDQMSYFDFNSIVAKTATGLLELGIKYKDRVIVFIPISTELYISIAALQRIGAIPVLLDSYSRQEQLKIIVQNSEPSGIIAPNFIINAFSTLLEEFNIKIKISSDTNSKNEFLELSQLGQNKPSKITQVNQNDTALITYTTGSSGTPKGVNRTHKFLAAQHYALKRLFPYAFNDIDLPVFPVFALNNIASGISTVIPAIDISKPNESDAQILLTQIENCKVNCMTLAPSSFKNLATYCNTKNISLKKIKRVLTGGAPISETDIKKFITIAPNSKTWILYGSTEVEPIAFIESKKMLSTKQPKKKNITMIGVNVGKIDKELKYKFLEIENGNNEVAKGNVGELIVSGEHVCQGYYNNKQAFKTTKIKDENGLIWHKTGDLARIDSRGYLWIVGRKHNVIKKNGQYYFPVRPEIILKDIPNINNAAYLDLSINNNNLIFAVVTLKNDNEKEQEQCYKNIEKIFTQEKLPCDKIIFMHEIPMDVRHHSKVNYNSLRQKLYEILK